MKLINFSITTILAQIILLPIANAAEEESCPAVNDCLAKLDKGMQCDLLPVPERAMVSVLPSGMEFKLDMLRPDVYSFFDGGYFAMFIRSGRGKRITIVDVPETSMAGGTDSLFVQAFEAFMEGSERKPTSFDIIYSHGHYDHIGGATAFDQILKKKYRNAKVRIFGTSETLKFIQDSSSNRAPEPNRIIGEDGRSLKLQKGLVVNLDLVGGHMQSDLMIHIPRSNGEQAIAMHVDVVFPRWSPWPNLAVTSDVRSYLESIDRILEYDFDVFVPGHLRLGDRADVEDFGRFVRDLLDAGGKGVSTTGFDDFATAGYGKMFDASLPEYGNVWYAFIETVQKTQTNSCVRTMIEKWGCKVGGLSSTIYSHCFLAVTFAVLDE
jgi:glyoxylase-like metal-dependent hydrolase (beta-lactamase superfamily II)